jgi:hypothetical protein
MFPRKWDIDRRAPAKGVCDDRVLGAVITVLDLPANERCEALGSLAAPGIYPCGGCAAEGPEGYQSV